MSGSAHRAIRGLVARCVRVGSVIRNGVSAFCRRRVTKNRAINVRLHNASGYVRVGPVTIRGVVTATLRRTLPSAQFFVTSSRRRLLTQTTGLLSKRAIVFCSYCHSPSAGGPLRVGGASTAEPSYTRLNRSMLIRVSLFTLYSMLMRAHSGMSTTTLCCGPHLGGMIISR